MTVTTKEQAWAEVNRLFPTDYEKDEAASLRAGYDIYRHPTLNYYTRICDLGCRLEVLTGEYGETVTNIWIVSEPEQETTPAPSYGEALCNQIRARLIANEIKHSQLNDYEKFLLDRGWEFKTEDALKAGYNRRWKAAHDIPLTEAEFIAEAQGNHPDNYDVDILKEVYVILIGLVNEKKLRPAEICGYAHFKWCLHNPAALLSYQEAQNKWHINNCGSEVSEDEAIVLVNGEWGFEASRIKIIGKAYSESTDWQFIRFDCAHMTWLWKNGNLYQVYA